VFVVQFTPNKERVELERRILKRFGPGGEGGEE
jgi:hypothetical protein